MNVLFATTVLPSRQRTGGALVSQTLIDTLRGAGARVTVLGYRRPHDRAAGDDDEITVGARPIETQTAGAHVLAWALGSLLRRHAFSAEKFYSRAYLRSLDEACRARAYSLAIVDRGQAAWLLDSASLPRRLIYMAHNVEHELYADKSRRSGVAARLVYAREARLIRRSEQRLVDRASEVWTLTDADASTFRGMGARRVRVLCVPANVEPASEVEPRHDIGIIGTWTWAANRDGLRWFFDEVYPLLPRKLSVRVAGSGADWLAGRYANVEYLGFVPSASSFMAESSVLAIPSTAGGGIQIKTLDAIASGRPVVATGKAMRGIGDAPPFVLVRDTPRGFADGLLAQLADGDRPGADVGRRWSLARLERFRADVATALV